MHWPGLYVLGCCSVHYYCPSVVPISICPWDMVPGAEGESIVGHATHFMSSFRNSRKPYSLPVTLVSLTGLSRSQLLGYSHSAITPRSDDLGERSVISLSSYLRRREFNRVSTLSIYICLCLFLALSLLGLKPLPPSTGLSDQCPSISPGLIIPLQPTPTSSPAFPSPVL